MSRPPGKTKRKNYTLRINEDIIKKVSIRAIMENTKISVVIEKYLIDYADGVDFNLKKKG